MFTEPYECPAYDKDGEALISWIALVSGNCIYGPLSAASWTLGWVSFAIWLCAQLPQVLENYINKSVEGLSLSFLMIWFIGDVTNFIGCILTSQLPFQTALSLYYICIDSILLVQYVYYKRLAKPWHLNDVQHSSFSSSSSSGGGYYSGDGFSGAAEDQDHDDMVTEQVSEVPLDISRVRPSSSPGIRALITSSFVASFGRAHAMPVPGLNLQPNSSGSGGLFRLTDAKYIGRISAWICAFMYLSSRVPQIYKNFRRQSTWGTSIHLFVAALCGNLTYALSVVLSHDARGPHARAFFVNELPYLLGSAGTVLFDSVIFLQHCTYGKKHPRQHHQHEHGSVLSQSGSSDHAGSAPIGIRVHQRPHHVYRDAAEPDDDETTPLAYSLQSQY